MGSGHLAADDAENGGEAITVTRSRPAIRVIALHGVESSGKSMLAQRLAVHYRTAWVPEYGRTYAEVHGTVMDEADLLLIGATQAAMIEDAAPLSSTLLIADTDTLMTAAWAQMMIGHMPDALLAAPKADLYLHMAADTEWVADDVRIYGDPATRARFDTICRNVLEQAGVNHLTISGDWDERFVRAVAAIDTLSVPGHVQPFDLGAQNE